MADDQRGEYYPLRTMDTLSEGTPDKDDLLVEYPPPPAYENSGFSPSKGFWRGLIIGFCLMLIIEYFQGVLVTQLMIVDGLSADSPDSLRYLLRDANPICGFDDIYLRSGMPRSPMASRLGYALGTKDLIWVMLVSLASSISCFLYVHTKPFLGDSFSKGVLAAGILLCVGFCVSLAGVIMVWEIGEQQIWASLNGLPDVWTMIQPFCNISRTADKNLRYGVCHSLT